MHKKTKENIIKKMATYLMDKMKYFIKKLSEEEGVSDISGLYEEVKKKQLSKKQSYKKSLYKKQSYKKLSSRKISPLTKRLRQLKVYRRDNSDEMEYSDWHRLGLDHYFGLLFLLKRHPDCCYLSLKEYMYDKYEKLKWEDDKFTNMIDYSTCMDDKTRFVMIDLSYKVKKFDNLHANTLIIDKKNKTIERFEPHGSHEYDSKLDEDLKELFKEFKYIPPLEFCPYYGPQAIEGQQVPDIPTIKEETEKKTCKCHIKRKSKTDPEGYCEPWSLWYADMRLSYPDIPIKELVVTGIQKIQRKNKTFRHFIRAYSQSIVELQTDILGRKKEDINYNTPLSDIEYNILKVYIINELNKQTYYLDTL